MSKNVAVFSCNRHSIHHRNELWLRIGRSHVEFGGGDAFWPAKTLPVQIRWRHNGASSLVRSAANDRTYRNPPRITTSSSAEDARSRFSRFGFSVLAFLVSRFSRFAFAVRCLARLCCVRGESSIQRGMLVPVCVAPARRVFAASRGVPHPVAANARKRQRSAVRQ